jgi:hypothetical protein
MRETFIELKNLSAAKSLGKDLEGGMFGRHLSELADQIEMR